MSEEPKPMAVPADQPTNLIPKEKLEELQAKHKGKLWMLPYLLDGEPRALLFRKWTKAEYEEWGYNVGKSDGVALEANKVAYYSQVVYPETPEDRRALHEDVPGLPNSLGVELQLISRGEATSRAKKA